MKADQFIAEAGFKVERIDGKDYPDEILPVVCSADYDMNVLFGGRGKTRVTKECRDGMVCRKKSEFTL